MSSSKQRHRSNLNFAVTTFFGLIALTTGFYIGLISTKGALIETGKGTNNAAYYQNLWQNRPDIFNLLLVTIAYAFVMLLVLLIFGRFNKNIRRKKDIQDIERLGELLEKGLLTREEFEKKKTDLLDDDES